MEQFYAYADEVGKIIGYYTDAVHEPEQIPETAIPITAEQWQDSLANPGKYQVLGEVFSELDGWDYIEPAVVLQAAKDTKIAELNAACNNTILSGFISDAVGEEHFYDFDYEAQTNLGGMLNAITADIVTEPVYWKASGVPVLHTLAQFKTLFADGLTFKNTMIGTYWTLKAAVIAAATVEDIDLIAWEDE